ncbi:MAG TPA: phosphoribosylamine--glycine ligase [Acholeplasmataceae bacterium]|jgi:phosphoribosylamine--glycine ligase|nr:phosphoribosylamine--glycine ligase [Acholeplasmataceae bacterium]
MKVLVVGSGGREHAIVQSLSSSPLCTRIYAARGNAGMKGAERIDIPETDVEGLASFAVREGIGLTVVGPELPLSLGIVNVFRERGLNIFGPTREAARIETSKEFAKELMARYGIPTASYRVAETLDEAWGTIKERGYPAVLKFDGLAAGKGVAIVRTTTEAEQFLETVFVRKTFGPGRIIIEEYLEGPEFSLMALVNGRKVYPLAVAQDHKRAYDGDVGPNTGGMGAYSPVPFIDSADIESAMETIMISTAAALAEMGCPFTGVLYGGLMKTATGIKVIEFNARFGDPETEVVLPRLKSDLLSVILDVLDGKDITLEWSDDIVLGVVLAAEGYPGGYERGTVITGIPNNDVFHMGTTIHDGKIVNSGGRVLIALGRGLTYHDAQNTAYKKAGCISGRLFYRRDIGYQAVNFEKQKSGG